MQPFSIVSGVAAPLLRDDINTDQVTPTAFMLSLEPDWRAALFGNWRRKPDGSVNTDFVLERPQYKRSQILVTGANFGCGSSREHAAWAISGFGIKCIIAGSFADIFRSNCLKNGILPVSLDAERLSELASEVVAVDGAASFTVDLVQQTIRCPSGREFSFDIAPNEKEALLEGLDDIGLTLKHSDAIAGWETRTAHLLPWLQAMAETAAKG